MTNLNLNITAILLARVAKDSNPFDLSMIYLVLAMCSLFFLVLIFIFLRNRAVQLVRLWYITLRYGRYSHEFLTFFKDNNLRSPFNGCIKDEISMHPLVFYRRINDSQEFRTNTAIDYGPIPYMTNYREILKKKGTPNCMKVSTVIENRFMVIGYNESLQGLKMKSMYFFLNDRFIMGEFLFSDLMRAKPSKLAGTLFSKYLNSIQAEKDVFYITDVKGNQLNYENNGFSVSIKYLFNGDSESNSILETLATTGIYPVDDEQFISTNEELLDRF